MQHLKQNSLVLSKMTWGIWRILYRALENLKVLHFNGLLLNKVHNLPTEKKYRGVLLDGTEYWCNTWRKTYLLFQKWHEEFDEFWPEHSKISKICILMGFFWTKYIIFELKKSPGVLLDGTEYWCNIWRKTDLCFQKWHEEFDEFWPKHSKISKICSLMGFFWLKYMIFELKKV